MQSKYITDELCRRIEERLPEPSRGCWHFSWTYGLRISDIVGIRKKDIDSRGFLHYMAKKTGKPSTVKLSAGDVEKYVDKLRRASAHLFPSPRRSGAPITRQAVWKNIKKVCSDLGIDAHGISPHSGRKHFAVEVFKERGFGAAMSALNHTNPATTAVYVYSKNPIDDINALLDELCDTVDGILLLLDRICNDLGYPDVRYTLNH